MQAYDRVVDWNETEWWWPTAQAEINSYAQFESSLELTDIQSAWIALTADSLYKLWINDEFIVMGPLREVPPYLYYDALDITEYLQVGLNTIRILVHYIGESNGSYQPHQAGLAVQGMVHTADASIHLDDKRQWRAALASEFLPSQRLGGCIAFSEHVSLPQASTIDWQEPITVGTLPLAGREHLLQRDLPFFTGDLYSARLLTDNLFDFNQEVFGFISLCFSAPTDCEFQIHYAEHLTDAAVNSSKQGMQYFDTINVCAGEHRWRSFDKRAMRYVFITDARIDIQSLSIQEYGYPYNDADISAECELDQAIKKISARTIALCSDDLLNDCPWRERAQYLDPFFYFEAMQKLFGTLEPARRYIRQFMRGANAEGFLRMSYPSPANASVIPDFALSFPLVLNHYYQLSGDIDTLRACFSSAQQAVASYQPFEDANQLLTDVPGWIFLDNSFELSKHPRSAALNAIYAGAHHQLAELATVLGEQGVAESNRKVFDILRGQFRDAFIDNGRVRESDISDEARTYHYWNLHCSAISGKWSGDAARLVSTLHLPVDNCELRFAFYGSCRVHIDDECVLDAAQGGSWQDAALFAPQQCVINRPAGSYALKIELGYSAIDWEVYISAAEQLSFGPVDLTIGDQHWSCNFRPHYWGVHSQIVSGYVAYHGMLDDDEAHTALQACLADDYYFNFSKRTTPFFATISDDDALLSQRVIPCNTPASLFYFAHALKRYGLEHEMHEYLRRIYAQMIDQGATSWWEEWGQRSSLCHAWGASVAAFLP